jgi:hypothetical protein
MSAEEPPEVTKARNDNSHGTNFPDSPEPIYGTQYLPRKFKIAVTAAGDNSVDILTNDIGVVVVSDDAGEPVGFNIYVRPTKNILQSISAFDNIFFFHANLFYNVSLALSFRLVVAWEEHTEWKLHSLGWLIHWVMFQKKIYYML